MELLIRPPWIKKNLGVINPLLFNPNTYDSGGHRSEAGSGTGFRPVVSRHAEIWPLF